MTKTIGIRREDKNEWEKRVPLVPADVRELLTNTDLDVIVQPSPIRIFRDNEYKEAGAIIDESLDKAETIFAVKEIPSQLLESGKTYVFFSHTIKGQPYNMRMLRQLMDLKCNLIDYEKMSDSNGARIITFSLFAGMAGFIETLYAYARKMELRGVQTPFRNLKQAYQYESIEQAKDELKNISEEISKNGMPSELHPLTIGVLGYGNVSKGAQGLLELLPIKPLSPDQLAAGLKGEEQDSRFIYTTVFKEEDMVEPKSGVFNLQDYYMHPENYKSKFDHYLPDLNILLNCVYWTEDFPRTISRQSLKQNLNKGVGLRVIGDISCDIEGSIEITKDSTKPDNACYTYSVENDKFEDGNLENGITIMAIDNLPCEFSREASSSFSGELKEYVEAIASADYNVSFQELQLPGEVKKAVILLKGELTPDYQYIAEFL